MRLTIQLAVPVAKTLPVRPFLVAASLATALAWMATLQPPETGFRLLPVRLGIMTLTVYSAFLFDDPAGRLTNPAPHPLRLRRLLKATYGFLTSAEPTERIEAIRDNTRAIEEAAQLGADCLVMVVGGLPSGERDLDGARQRVVEGIGMLVDHAAKNGVQLALEPMHPMYCADRGVLSTLEQAVTMAEQFRPEEVGVVVDTFHVWWDPRVFEQIARAAGRILSFQVSDWITPMPSDPLLARGLMGDGHIDFPPFLRAVRAAGYDGDTEVEIFNADLWNLDPSFLLSEVVDRYIRCGLGSEE
ncbi:MAG: sugar phosphate isomerase/epimerase family protein [Acidimicrobiia bacterium]